MAEMARRRAILAAVLLGFFSFSGCGGARSSKPALRVGFVPSENVQQVAQNAQPIVDILRKELDMEVEPFVATDYTGVVETELFASTYRSYALATVRYPVLEVEGRVEPFENGNGFSLRVMRAGQPRLKQKRQT